MKIFFTICLLLATTCTVKAQTMSFEETVKYINDKIICCTENKTDFIKVKRDGTIEWLDKSVNLFNLNPIEVTENPLVHKEGMGIFKGISTFCIYFQVTVTGDSDAVLNRFKIYPDAERVYKALLHLKSLCTKEKDPFDN